jgi:uncharacterized protein YeeX (DUF496 family)
MLAGVEILLERMKTNPEEFIEGEMSKWSRVMSSGWEVFNEQERTALQDAIRSAKRDHFNGEVMRVLTQGHDDQLVRVDDYLVKQSAVVSKKSMMNQTTKLLSDEFDKAYAKREIYKGKPHA